MMIEILFLLVMAVEPECLQIDRPQITAGDLARKLPPFEAMAPDAVLAPAPIYGARRELGVATLLKWLDGRNVNPASLSPVCIYRRVLGGDEIGWAGEVRDALDSLFGFKPGTGELEILAHRISPAGPGKLSLPRQGLTFDLLSGQYTWRGHIIGEGPAAAVRVQFQLKRKERRIVAARPLPAGRALVAEDFEWMEFPFRPELPAAEKLTELPLGQVLRRSLPKSTTILAQHLTQAPMISPGDEVELLSRSGEAVIRIQGVARSKARMGDPVIVAALDGKRMLRAIAIAPGKVEIQSAIPRRTK